MTNLVFLDEDLSKFEVSGIVGKLDNENNISNYKFIYEYNITFMDNIEKSILSYLLASYFTMTSCNANITILNELMNYQLDNPIIIN